MQFVGWAVLLICLFVGATLFFSVHAIALRCFSRLRLQEAFKTADGEERPELVEAVTGAEPDFALDLLEPDAAVAAAIGLGINLLVAWLLSRGERNLNTRAALLHVMGDLLGSVAALLLQAHNRIRHGSRVAE